MQSPKNVISDPKQPSYKKDGFAKKARVKDINSNQEMAVIIDYWQKFNKDNSKQPV